MGQLSDYLRPAARPIRKGSGEQRFRTGAISRERDRAVFESVLGKALGEHGEVIRPNGKDVRAVKKDIVHFAFKAAYQEQKPDADKAAVKTAWLRAIKASGAIKEEVNGIEYLCGAPFSFPLWVHGNMFQLVPISSSRSRVSSPQAMARLPQLRLHSCAGGAWGVCFTQRHTRAGRSTR